MLEAAEIGKYYDEKYFAWQRNVGEFGGLAEAWKFKPYIKPGDRVVDFGCGGGYLLSNFVCAEKIGVEINAAARANCERLGIQAFPEIDDVGDGWADVVISHHALEHVPNPLEALVELRRKIRPGGLAIFVVPCESIGTAYRPNDVNNHLFTWSPMNLGNLVHFAGYEVLQATPLLHRTLPRHQFVQRMVGWTLYQYGCWAYGTVFRRLSQLRVVARNPG